jgi:hypothetical protein
VIFASNFEITCANASIAYFILVLRLMLVEFDDCCVFWYLPNLHESKNNIMAFCKFGKDAEYYTKSLIVLY